MQNRCKSRIVVCRNLASTPRLLGLRVLLRVGAADEPEDRRRLPRGAEHSEVLARRGGLGFADSVATEILPESVDDSLCRVRIVGDQRVAIQGRDLRRLRTA